MFTRVLEIARILTDRMKGTLGYVPRGLAQGMFNSGNGELMEELSADRLGALRLACKF
jgi:hypothetical protein